MNNKNPVRELDELEDMLTSIKIQVAKWEDNRDQLIGVMEAYTKRVDESGLSNYYKDQIGIKITLINKALVINNP